MNIYIGDDYISAAEGSCDKSNVNCDVDDFTEVIEDCSDYEKYSTQLLRYCNSLPMF